MNKCNAGICILVLNLIAGQVLAGTGEPSYPSLVPWPQSNFKASGTLALAKRACVYYSDAKLEPLAVILADEIKSVTGRVLPVKKGKAGWGDIALAFNQKLTGEAYTLDISSRAIVEGGNYGAVALGTVTLLQSLNTGRETVSLPCLKIEDRPATDFRSLMIDVARRFHSIDNLKQIVKMCRLYKVRYLQLHLTDDPLFMFPSKAYPEISSKNDHGTKPYSLDELNELVAYADARNVTIIPEYEVPGHSGEVNRAMPDLFKIKGTKPYEHHASINYPKPEVMKAVETIVGEMCEVFKSTPYFHIGGDEADFAFADQNEHFQALEKKLGLANHHELYRWFVVQMNEIVKKNGKKMIVWEGFGREPNSPVKIPKDIIVMEYEVRFYQPNNLVADGYQVVNASWTPLYVVNRTVRPQAEIFNWNLYQFKPYGAKAEDKGTIAEKTPLVLGSQMCAWEQPQELEIPSLRGRVPAMAERIWNPEAGQSYDAFKSRFAATDAILEKLIYSVHFKCDGLSNVEDRLFDKSMTLTMTSEVPGTIRYTIDGKIPTAESPAYTGPLTIDKTTSVRAVLFDAAGKQVGTLTEDQFRQTPENAKPK